MKLTHALTALSTLTILNLTSIANAESATCEKSPCEKSTCDKSSCDTDANTVNLAVTGMTCGGCSAKVTKALQAVEGVTAQKVSHKSGLVSFTFDPAKTDKSKVIAAVKATGFKVAGEKLSIPVTGMTCGGCSKKVTTALAAIDGCTVGSVCHKSGHAEVTIDPAKTSKEKVIEVINKTGFKAQEAKATEKKES